MNFLRRLKWRQGGGRSVWPLGQGVVGMFPELKGLFVAGPATGRFSISSEKRRLIGWGNFSRGRRRRDRFRVTPPRQNRDPANASNGESEEYPKEDHLSRRTPFVFSRLRH